MMSVKINKQVLLSIMLTAVSLSSTAFADLPTPSRANQQNQNGQYSPYIQNGGQYNRGAQYNQNQYSPYIYGQGNGNGASYNTQPTYQSRNSINTNSTSKTSSLGDLLWIFTGSDSTIKDQVKSGFHSNSSTTFGGRLLSFFIGAAYSRFGAPIANKLGALENSALNRVTGNQLATQNPYGQGNGAAYCYECTQQNSTNPYQRNQQAINPAIFNSANATATTGTGARSAGGIR